MSHVSSTVEDFFCWRVVWNATVYHALLETGRKTKNGQGDETRRDTGSAQWHNCDCNCSRSRSNSNSNSKSNRNRNSNSNSSNNQQPTTNNQQPTINDQQSATNNYPTHITHSTHSTNSTNNSNNSNNSHNSTNHHPPPTTQQSAKSKQQPPKLAEFLCSDETFAQCCVVTFSSQSELCSWQCLFLSTRWHRTQALSHISLKHFATTTCAARVTPISLCRTATTIGKFVQILYFFGRLSLNSLAL